MQLSVGSLQCGCGGSQLQETSPSLIHLQPDWADKGRAGCLQSPRSGCRKAPLLGLLLPLGHPSRPGRSWPCRCLSRGTSPQVPPQSGDKITAWPAPAHGPMNYAAGVIRWFCSVDRDYAPGVPPRKVWETA